MPPPLRVRPEPTELSDFYRRYVAAVPDGDVVQTLRRQGAALAELLDEIGEERSNHRYAPGKWSVKEVAGHVADSERVFAYRALRFARGDPAELPGFDEEAYVRAADFERRPLEALARELGALRSATVELVASFRPAELARVGTANGARVSVRALVWIVAGHELHHQRVLRERYLPTLPA